MQAVISSIALLTAVVAVESDLVTLVGGVLLVSGSLQTRVVLAVGVI